MSREGESPLTAASPRLRWRRSKGAAFATLAAASLALGALVVVVLILSTLRQSLGIVAMHATARAGVALSLRSMTGVGPDGSGTAPYVAVSQVDEGSPAAGAGLAPGDALIKVDGRPMHDVREVWATVGALPLDGQPVEIAWVPNLEALLGELTPLAVPGELGTFEVQLSWVPSGSAAAAAGLEESDVLLRAGETAVTGTQQAWQALVVEARRREGSVPLTVRRSGETLTVDLPVERRAAVPLEGGFWSAMGHFVTTLDEPRYPERAGIASAVLGSLYVILVTALVAFPLGAAAAVYLEEYAPSNVLTETIQVLIANLAGIPSVVYGILGLEILARTAGLGRSILAGGLTLGLLVLPVMILASREALRAVPPWVREAAYSVGATRWQVVRHQVLPYSLAGMLTAMILSLSRAIGEAAPLILLGAFLYVTYLPESLMDTFTVVPLQIFSWATKPQAGYDTIAAAAILVLLALLLLLNGAAIYLRNRYQKQW